MDMHTLIVRASCLLLTGALVSGCSGGDDEDEEEDNDVDASGIFTGTLTPDGLAAIPGATLIAVPDGRFALLSGKALFIGTGTTSGSSFSANATGYAPTGTTFANGVTSSAFTLSGTASERNNLNGAYSGAGESGRVALTYSTALSNRPASLSTVSGTYTLPTSQTGVTGSLVVNSGPMDLSASNGCIATGAIQVADATRNLYTWSMTFSNCTTTNGVYSGVAYMPTTSVLVLIGNSPTNPLPQVIPGTK